MRGIVIVVIISMTTPDSARIRRISHLEEVVEQGGHEGMALDVVGLLQDPNEDGDVVRELAQDEVEALGVGGHLDQDG